MSARTFKLTSPAMHGPDVELLQRDVNAQFKRWGVNHSVKLDAAYGPHTRDALLTILYGLGVAKSILDHGATPAIRRKVRKRWLNPAERVRYRARKDWRARLVKRYKGHGPELALAWAKSMVGVTESPPGSNRGRLIDTWERLCQVLGAPWCGCFTNRALMAAGFPAQPWLRYCPWVEQRAKAGEGGWSWHPPGEARAGDIALYGADIAHHQGLVKAVQDTYEGNTSNGPGGNQSNGGIVAHRTDRDWKDPSFPCRGVARPPYASVTS
jgi:hypothetical protein